MSTESITKIIKLLEEADSDIEFIQRDGDFNDKNQYAFLRKARSAITEALDSLERLTDE